MRAWGSSWLAAILKGRTNRVIAFRMQPKPSWDAAGVHTGHSRQPLPMQSKQKLSNTGKIFKGGTRSPSAFAKHLPPATSLSPHGVRARAWTYLPHSEWRLTFFSSGSVSLKEELDLVTHAAEFTQDFLFGALGVRQPQRKMFAMRPLLFTTPSTPDQTGPRSGSPPLRG